MFLNTWMHNISKMLYLNFMSIGFGLTKFLYLCFTWTFYIKYFIVINFSVFSTAHVFKIGGFPNIKTTAPLFLTFWTLLLYIHILWASVVTIFILHNKLTKFFARIRVFFLRRVLKKWKIFNSKKSLGVTLKKTIILWMNLDFSISDDT